jgi:hypothetical protein
MRLSPRRIALGAAIAATALACSENPGAVRNPSLSAAQADSIAAAFVADLDGMPEGAVLEVLGLPLTAPEGATGTTACIPTVTPVPPVNSDDDLIPDSIHIDFTGCVIERRHYVVELSGAKDIVDMQPLVAGHHVRARFIDFGQSVTRIDRPGSWSVTHNGVRQFSASATELLAQEIDFLSEYVFPDGATAEHERDWSSVFTVDPGLEITTRHLPAGTWVVNGTSAWTKGERSWSLAVTTLAGLHYDPACEFRPRFDDGAVQIVATRGDQTSTVTIEFTACGEYTVTRS